MQDEVERRKALVRVHIEQAARRGRGLWAGCGACAASALILVFVSVPFALLFCAIAVALAGIARYECAAYDCTDACAAAAGWRRVEDELPTAHEVLYSDVHGDVDVFMPCTGREPENQAAARCARFGITHWMPLPPPAMPPATVGRYACTRCGTGTVPERAPGRICPDCVEDMRRKA